MLHMLSVMSEERLDTLPAYRELPIRDDLPPGSAWGVFGDDDRIGTLNFASSEAVRHAATLVKRGDIFPLNWRADRPNPAIMGRGSMRRTQLTSMEVPASDDFLDGYYPQSSSQWDALKHAGNKTYGFYNGHAASEVLAAPDTDVLGIQTWAERGIAGRFVLLDLDRIAGGEGLDQTASIAVTPTDLDKALRIQGVELRSGDILLLRFGWVRWYEQLGPQDRELLATKPMFPSPGLAPDDGTIEWLWNKRVAAVATDNPMVEVMPAPDQDQLHHRLIPLLGMALGEMFNLEQLADDCWLSGVYEGLFVAAPLNVRGGSGSSANAIAIK